jgi:hypothetical protein
MLNTTLRSKSSLLLNVYSICVVLVSILLYWRLWKTCFKGPNGCLDIFKILRAGTSKCQGESKHLLIHSHNWRNTTETQELSSNTIQAVIVLSVEGYPKTVRWLSQVRINALKAHVSICLTTELCTNCLTNGAQTMFTMKMRLNDVQKRFGSIQDVCQSCSGVLSSLSASVAIPSEAAFGSSTGYADHPCDSIDCPVFFQRQKLKRDVRVLSAYDTIIDRWF